jgi:3-hydroxybenzoate 6-monooxygenase
MRPGIEACRHGPLALPPAVEPISRGRRQTMHIAIAGGGIAGLSCAVALARRGHRITLVERADVFSETGAGIQLGPNGVHALAALGLVERLAGRVVRPARLVVHSGAGGRVVAAAELGDTIAARFGAAWFTVLRTDLQQALLDAARESPQIALRTGCAIAGYTERAGHIEARLADGSILAADALVGADGIRSTIRARMLADGAPADAGVVIYRALVPAGMVPDWAREADVHLWLMAGGHVVHYPVAAGASVNIVAMRQGTWSGEGWSAPVEPGEVFAAFAATAPALAEVLKAPGGWLKWAGRDRPPAARWSAGRAVLVGDAAHPVLPCLAQGAVMALEDAVVLAGLIEPDAGDPLPAFAAFQARRQARTARVQGESRRQARIYHLGGPARLARDAALATVFSGDRLTGRNAWLYRWQPSGQGRRH